MSAKCRSDIDNVDRFRLERLRRRSELVRAVLVRVNRLVLIRRTEEEEDARRESGGGRSVLHGESEISPRGERGRDREFSEGRTERGFPAAGEPAD